MAEEEKFDLSAAVAALPDYPEPSHIQGPDMARFRFGSSVIRAVSDGGMTLPFRALAPDAAPGDLAQKLGLDAAPKWGRGELTSVLIEQGVNMVLIDAGAGPYWQKGAGRLLEHLAANAVAPETITHIVMTHLHPDHAWGALTASGARAFPNARLCVGAAEHGFWSKPGLADKVQPVFRLGVEGAVKVLEAYRDRITMLREGDEVIPGLSVIDTPGHSVGHISLLYDQGPGVIFAGDAVVNDTISFAEPDWAFGFDTDADQARVSRRRILEMATRDGQAMMGYHWNWPGIGHTEKDGHGYRFLPRDTF